jgi:hypothetical protein
MSFAALAGRGLYSSPRAPCRERHDDVSEQLRLLVVLSNSEFVPNLPQSWRTLYDDARRHDIALTTLVVTLQASNIQRAASRQAEGWGWK